MMGVGYLGEVRQGPDGAHYQYVQGVDGLGHTHRFLVEAISASSATLLSDAWRHLFQEGLRLSRWRLRS